MMAIIDMITVLAAIYIVGITVKRIFNNKANTLHYCIIAFFMVQVIPLVLKLFWGNPDTDSHIIMEKAMKDLRTCLIYDIFVILTMVLLSYAGKKISVKNGRSLNSFSLFTNEKILKALPFRDSSKALQIILATLSILIFLPPIVAIIMAPNPIVYMRFSYFYTHDYRPEEMEYHNSIMSIALWISTLAILMKYYLKNKKSNLSYYIATIWITWIDGKRTLTLFILAGILAIDLVKGEFHRKKIRQIAKALIFNTVFLLYFIIYNRITGKESNGPFYYMYNEYFARMSIVETSIYDKLYTNTLLDYPGQSLLFNVLAWIPRRIWPEKPIMYCIYHTSYSDGYSSSTRLNYNLQVNVWSEWISNLGILMGVVLAVAFLYFIVKKSIKSRSMIIYMLGTIFCVLYSVYGFEILVMCIFYLWVACVMITSLHKKLNRKGFLSDRASLGKGRDGS